MKSPFYTALLASSALVLAVAPSLAQPPPNGSEFEVLYDFTSGRNANQPYPLSLTVSGDALYGTTVEGGGDPICMAATDPCSTAFKLTPPSSGSQWTEAVIHRFISSFPPYPNVLTPANDGSFYGSTPYGNGSVGCEGVGCGTIFKLTPPKKGQTEWGYTLIYSFTGGSDGGFPNAITIGRDGALYGTTLEGGDANCPAGGSANTPGCGVVFKFNAHNQNQWKETILHSFTGGKNASFPRETVIFGDDGSLFGTASGGGGKPCTEGDNGSGGCGAVYQLTQNRNGTWSESVLFGFSGGSEGGQPFNLIVKNDKLYGATGFGGDAKCNSIVGQGCGTVFSLTSDRNGWSQQTLYQFPGGNNGAYPVGLILNDNTLFGTTSSGGPITGRCRAINANTSQCGIVFELAPSKKSGSPWSETVLHTFDGDDGMTPIGHLVAVGDTLYGLTEFGGPPGNIPGGGQTAGNGIVYKLKP